MAVLAIAALGAFLAPAGYAAIGWAAGQFVGNMLFPPKGQDQNIQGPRFDDLKVQTSAYGQMIPIIAGTKKVTGNIIWKTPRRTVTTTTSQEQGGKGGGGQTVTQTSYSYFETFAVLLCEGEAVGVRKAWANEELKYNVAADATSETVMASGLMATAIRFYPGSEIQEVDPLIYADKGVDTPAYRGYCYIVIEDMDVTAYSGNIPQLSFEVVTAGTAADLAVPTVATLGATDGSVFAVLGRAGNIYAGSTTVGGLTNRWNFYSGSKLGTYTPPVFTYSPVGLTSAGEAIASGFGGNITVLHDDGSVTQYTGGLGAFQGSGYLSNHYAHGVYPEDDSVWWFRGSTSAATNVYRAGVSGTVMTTTLLSGVHCFQFARNATGIAGRLYMHAAATLAGQKYLAYVNTQTSSLVLLVSQSNTGGIMVSSDGYIWMGPADSVAERKTVRKYDADGALLLTVDIDNIEAASGWRCYEDTAGMIWAVGVTNARAYKIHPTTGEIIAQSAVFVGSLLGFTEDNRAVIWDGSTGSYLLKEIERLPRLTLGTTALSAFVTELCGRVGLVPGDLDVSELSDTIAGYAIARRDSVRSAIAPPQIAYKFDALESDEKIKFHKRGGSVVATIPEDDLAAHMFGDAQPASIANTRKLETELPREVEVRYEDQAADYQLASQYARRLTGQSDEVATLDVPMVLTHAHAAEVAEFVLYERWSGRTAGEISLSRKYCYLEPSDIVTVTSGGISYTLRIVERSETGGLSKLRTVTEDVSVYDAVATGVALPAPVSTVGVAGPTILRLLDIPLLRDEDDGAGFYAAAAGYYDGWPGAELWGSRDGGVTYERGTTAFLEPNVMGSALTAIANFTGGNVFDERSSVQVQVFGGTLSSTSEALVLAGANAAYLGGEIIQFKNATLNAAGRYTLTGLLRGRKGTEQYMTTHAIGDQFVLLDATTTRRVALESADIGASLIYKAPAFGQTVAEAVPVAFTPAGVGLEPLSPVLLGIGRTAAASYDIIINWVRRARLNAEWRDYVDVPVGETTESYVVEIYTNGTYPLPIKRTISGLTTPTATYTSAQQVTDFGSNQATIYVKVYQVSAIAGNGFALTGSG